MNCRKRFGVILLALCLIASMGSSTALTAAIPGGSDGYVEHKGCVDVPPPTLKGDVMWEGPVSEAAGESGSQAAAYEVIRPEQYTVYHKTLTGESLAVEHGEAMGGETVTLYARNDFSGYLLAPKSPGKTTITIEPTRICEYQEFRVLEDGWYRITPCYKLNWGIEGLQQYCVVAKKGNQYVIWTKDELNEEEKYAIYESFSTKVNGMFGAKYENCQFMYANGSTLEGVTINDEYILFDVKATWSLYAVGAYLPSYERYYESGSSNEYTFYYCENGQSRA